MTIDKALFDQMTAQPVRAPGSRTIRPSHAATLILLRHDLDGPKVLMGRRRENLTFMGGKWVFPGGKVDRADYGSLAATELEPKEARRLSLNIARNSPTKLARGLAMAAIRETFEEAGLLLAKPTTTMTAGGPWRAFHAQGALPDLAALSFIARAVTPPYRPRRFDTRFFLADAARLLRPEPCEVCGELETLAWIGLDETDEIDLPAVTRFVLRAVKLRQTQPALPVTTLRLHRGAPKVDQLIG